MYVHVPFCATRCDYCAFATWTDRPHLVGDYLDALARPTSAARSTPGWRRRRACSSAAARRRSCRPTGLAARAAGDPAAPRRRGHGRVQPRRRHARRCSRRTPPPASTGSRSACSRWCPHVLAALGRTHDPANVERAVAAVRAVGLPTFNLDVIYGAAGESLADWRTTLERALDARPAARLGVRAHRRGRHAARRRPGPAPRRRRAGRRVRARRRAADRRRARQLRGVELGPPRPRVPPQPPLLAPARLPRRSAAPPTRTAPGGGGGTCARPSATSPPSAPAARPRPPASRSTPTPGASRACSCRCARRPACPSTALDGDELPGVVERDGDRWVLTRRGRLMANEVAVRLR